MAIKFCFHHVYLIMAILFVENPLRLRSRILFLYNELVNYLQWWAEANY